MEHSIKFPNSTYGPANFEEWSRIKLIAKLMTEDVTSELVALIPSLDDSELSMIGVTFNTLSFQIIGPRREALMAFIVGLLNTDPTNEIFAYTIDGGHIQSHFTGDRPEDRS